MRAIGLFFYVLAALALAAWVYFYIFISSMACAFGNPNANGCSIRPPWQLGGEDLLFMMAAPAFITISLFLVGLMCRQT